MDLGGDFWSTIRSTKRIQHLQYHRFPVDIKIKKSKYFKSYTPVFMQGIQEVVGSIPSSSTKNIKGLEGFPSRPFLRGIYK
jgi:hypothetical protein